ncbi:MAG TPA: hypothetical protein VFT63_04250 [bacterium]|nr:hypothetical protein [bacterium]
MIEHDPDAELQVLDVDLERRHLLFLVKGRNNKARFLCGHDERHWFVAAIPESEPVKTVTEAFEALKPDEVRLVERHLRSDAKARRRNPKRFRQGEWFFIPAPNFTPPKGIPILKNEPLGRISNGRWFGRPHQMAEAVRFGGERVWVPTLGAIEDYPGGRTSLSRRVGTGLTDLERDVFLRDYKKGTTWRWESYVRNPEIYVRGTVRHPHHATLRLPFWHKAVQNTELQARAMVDVAFVD